MAQQLRTLKRRIESVKSTQKITRAMELIAAARISRAQERVEAARPYAEAMRRLVASVAGAVTNLDHPLLTEPEDARDVGLVVLTSDRGLAGPYNSNILRAAERDIREHEGDTKLFPVGKKGISYFKFRGYDFEDSWQGLGDQPKIEQAREVARAAAKRYADGEMRSLRLAYTRFESMMTQRPDVVQLLPVPSEELEQDEDEGQEGRRAPYLFEPEPERILDFLFPRYVEALIFHALLEASASEHAARRKAMKAATDNANDLIENLTRNYNQARQEEITTEIMEVVGGAEALSG